MSIDQVMQKLAKLRATEVSLRETGNVEAAESYAAKVAEMLLRHQISMVEVEASVRDQEDPIAETYVPGEARARIGWENRLARIIAHGNGCRHLIITGCNDIIFAGRKSSREVAAYLFGYLRREVDTYSKKERQRLYNWTKNHHPERIDEMKGWKKSFLNGFLATLEQRFDEMRQSVAAEIPYETMALVKADDALVKAYVDKVSTGTAKGLKISAGGNRAGFEAGQKFGQNVALVKGVSGDGSGQKQIGE